MRSDPYVRAWRRELASKVGRRRSDRASANVFAACGWPAGWPGGRASGEWPAGGGRPAGPAGHAEKAAGHLVKSGWPGGRPDPAKQAAGQARPSGRPGGRPALTTLWNARAPRNRAHGGFLYCPHFFCRGRVRSTFPAAPWPSAASPGSPAPPGGRKSHHLPGTGSYLDYIFSS